MNQLGLTHLSLRVDDVDGAASAIEAVGERWSAAPGPPSISRARLDFVYCTDPDACGSN